MATLQELNIIFKVKGIEQATRQINGLSESIGGQRNSIKGSFKSAEESAKVFTREFTRQTKEAKSRAMEFDRGLRELNSTLRNVGQLSSIVAASVGGPLIAAAFQASKTNVDLAASFREINNSTTDLVSSIGQSLVPIAQDVAVVVRKMVDAWLELPQAQRNSIVESAAWVAAIATATAAASKLLRVVIALIRNMAKLGGGGAAGLLGTSALGGASLIGGELLLKQIEEKITKAGLSGQQQIKGFITVVKDVVEAFSNPASVGVKAGMKVMSQKTGIKTPESGSDLFGNGVSSMGGVINLGSVSTSAEQTNEGLTSVQRTIQDIKREVDATFGELAVKLPTTGQMVATSLKTMFEGLTNGIGDAVAQSIVYGKSFEESFMASMKAIAAQVISFLVTTIAKILVLRAAGVVGPISSFALGLGGGSGGGSGSGGGGGGFGGFLRSLIPFADGGMVTKPTIGLLGEAGPEAVIPLDKMNEMGGGVNVNISGPVFLDDQAAVDKFVRKISDGVKRATGRRTGGLSIAL